MEPDFQPGSAARERLVLMMDATSLPNLTLAVPAYAELQREMHDALLVQHPEWIERDGNSSKCDDYDRRFAELLDFSLAFKRAHAY